MRGRRRAMVAALLFGAGILAGCGPVEGSTEVPAADDPIDAVDDSFVDATGGDGERGTDSADGEGQPEPAATAEPDEGPVSVAPSGDLEVHYLDVGQADATLLLHDDVAVLIDAGHWQRSEVVPHLRARGVETLDLVVITHPHADHIGQFDQVLDAFDVAEVWWSGSATTTATFDRALSALERSGALYEEPRTGDVAQLGPLTVEVVNPPVGVNLDDLHDAGLGLRITYGEVGFLFTGDSEAATEQRMVAESRAALAAEVLQLGHHGSSTSTTEAFLQAVDPSVAIYSAAAGNQYGHPHREVIDRLEAAGVETYGTDVHGSVVVVTDGVSWTVGTERDGAIVAAPEGGGGSETSAGGSASSGSGDDGSDDAGAEQAAAAVEGGGCAPGQVDINAAAPDELQRIIHIGPARADDLVTLRPFAAVSSLERISGIAAARLADIIEQGVACVG